MILPICCRGVLFVNLLFMIKKIAVLTSGGDAPGMNACIRAVVRTAAHFNVDTIGVLRGYEGLISNQFVPLNRESVSNIIHKGGTILKTARSDRFMTDEGRALAAASLRSNGVDGLIVIGGDGSFRGAIDLAKVTNVPMIGCPGTIDNDLAGTDFTIGYDTAINTVIDAIDRIRDTAESHDRIFVVEVMGRDAGLIALRSAIAGGAEALLVPEIRHDSNDLVKKIHEWRKTKASRIVVVAEGDESGGAIKVAEEIRNDSPQFDVRITILGHVQRGGNPTCMERVNASIMGYHAVRGLIDGRNLEMAGVVNRRIHFTPFEKAVKHKKSLDPELEELIAILGS
jgi:6-phosphofructokinase 1